MMRNQKEAENSRSRSPEKRTRIHRDTRISIYPKSNFERTFGIDILYISRWRARYIKPSVAAAVSAKRKLSSSSSSMDTKFHRGGESDRVFHGLIWLTRARVRPCRVPLSRFADVVQRAWARARRVPLDSSGSGSARPGLTLEPDDFKWPSAWAADRCSSSAASRRRPARSGDRRAGMTICRGRPRAWSSCALSASTRTWTSRRHRVTCTKVPAGYLRSRVKTRSREGIATDVEFFKFPSFSR